MPTKSKNKGLFHPTNPKKYKGDINNIRYLSNWEKEFMKFCDSNPNVIMWSSEEVVIPYMSPVDNKFHRYYPDFLIRVRKKDKTEENILIEIKPYKETQKPINKNKTGKASKRLIQEHATYMVNTAKWAAAKKWCDDRGIIFKIMTEKELFKK